MDTAELGIAWRRYGANLIRHAGDISEAGLGGGHCKSILGFHLPCKTPSGIGQCKARRRAWWEGPLLSRMTLAADHTAPQLHGRMRRTEISQLHACLSSLCVLVPRQSASGPCPLPPPDRCLPARLAAHERRRTRRVPPAGWDRRERTDHHDDQTSFAGARASSGARRSHHGGHGGHDDFTCNAL